MSECLQKDERNADVDDAATSDGGDGNENELGAPQADDGISAPHSRAPAFLTEFGEGESGSHQRRREYVQRRELSSDEDLLLAEHRRCSCERERAMAVLRRRRASGVRSAVAGATTEKDEAFYAGRARSEATLHQPCHHRSEFEWLRGTQLHRQMAELVRSHSSVDVLTLTGGLGSSPIPFHADKCDSPVGSVGKSARRERVRARRVEGKVRKPWRLASEEGMSYAKPMRRIVAASSPKFILDASRAAPGAQPDDALSQPLEVQSGATPHEPKSSTPAAQEENESLDPTTASRETRGATSFTPTDHDRLQHPKATRPHHTTLTLTLPPVSSPTATQRLQELKRSRFTVAASGSPLSAHLRDLNSPSGSMKDGEQIGVAVAQSPLRLPPLHAAVAAPCLLKDSTCAVSPVAVELQVKDQALSRHASGLPPLRRRPRGDPDEQMQPQQQQPSSPERDGHRAVELPGIAGRGEAQAGDQSPNSRSVARAVARKRNGRHLGRGIAGAARKVGSKLDSDKVGETTAEVDNLLSYAQRRRRIYSDSRFHEFGEAGSTAADEKEDRPLSPRVEQVPVAAVGASVQKLHEVVADRRKGAAKALPDDRRQFGKQRREVVLARAVQARGRARAARRSPPLEQQHHRLACRTPSRSAEWTRAVEANVSPDSDHALLDLVDSEFSKRQDTDPKELVHSNSSDGGSQCGRGAEAKRGTGSQASSGGGDGGPRPAPHIALSDVAAVSGAPSATQATKEHLDFSVQHSAARTTSADCGGSERESCSSGCPEPAPPCGSTDTATIAGGPAQGSKDSEGLRIDIVSACERPHDSLASSLRDALGETEGVSAQAALTPHTQRCEREPSGSSSSPLGSSCVFSAAPSPSARGACTPSFSCTPRQEVQAPGATRRVASVKRSPSSSVVSFAAALRADDDRDYQEHDRKSAGKRVGTVVQVGALLPSGSQTDGRAAITPLERLVKRVDSDVAESGSDADVERATTSDLHAGDDSSSSTDMKHRCRNRQWSSSTVSSSPPARFAAAAAGSVNSRDSPAGLRRTRSLPASAARAGMPEEQQEEKMGGRGHRRRGRSAAVRTPAPTCGNATPTAQQPSRAGRAMPSTTSTSSPLYVKPIDFSSRVDLLSASEIYQLTSSPYGLEAHCLHNLCTRAGPVAEARSDTRGSDESGRFDADPVALAAPKLEAEISISRCAGVALVISIEYCGNSRLCSVETALSQSPQSQGSGTSCCCCSSTAFASTAHTDALATAHAFRQQGFYVLELHDRPCCCNSTGSGEVPGALLRPTRATVMQMARSALANTMTGGACVVYIFGRGGHGVVPGWRGRPSAHTDAQHHAESAEGDACHFVFAADSDINHVNAENVVVLEEIADLMKHHHAPNKGGGDLRGAALPSDARADTADDVTSPIVFAEVAATRLAPGGVRAAASHVSYCYVHHRTAPVGELLEGLYDAPREDKLVAKTTSTRHSHRHLPLEQRRHLMTFFVIKALTNAHLIGSKSAQLPSSKQEAMRGAMTVNALNHALCTWLSNMSRLRRAWVKTTALSFTRTYRMQHLNELVADAATGRGVGSSTSSLFCDALSRSVTPLFTAQQLRAKIDGRDDVARPEAPIWCELQTLVDVGFDVSDLSRAQLVRAVEEHLAMLLKTDHARDDEREQTIVDVALEDADETARRERAAGGNSVQQQQKEPMTGRGGNKDRLERTRSRTLLRDRKAVRREQSRTNVPRVHSLHPQGAFVAFLDSDVMASYHLTERAFLNDFRRMAAIPTGNAPEDADTDADSGIRLRSPAGTRDVSVRFLPSEAAAIVYTHFHDAVVPKGDWESPVGAPRPRSPSTAGASAANGTRAEPRLADALESRVSSLASTADAGQANAHPGATGSPRCGPYRRNGSSSFITGDEWAQHDRLRLVKNSTSGVAESRAAIQQRYYVENDNRLLHRRMAIVAMQEHVRVLLRLPTPGLFYKLVKAIRSSANNSAATSGGPGFHVMAAGLLPSSPAQWRAAVQIQAVVRGRAVRSRVARIVLPLYRSFLDSCFHILEEHHRLLWGGCDTGGGVRVCPFEQVAILTPPREGEGTQWSGFGFELVLKCTCHSASSPMPATTPRSLVARRDEGALLALVAEERRVRSEFALMAAGEWSAVMRRVARRLEEVEEPRARAALAHHFDLFSLLMQQDMWRGVISLQVFRVFFVHMGALASATRAEAAQRGRVASQEASARAQLHSQRYMERSALLQRRGAW